MRRGFAKLVLFLLAGAIVNVAVAWGCAALICPVGPNVKTVKAWSDQFMHLGQATEALVQRSDAFGTTRLAVNAWSNVGEKAEPRADAVCPYWSDYAMALESRMLWAIQMQANGAPFRSFLFRYTAVQETNPIGVRIENGIVLDDFAGGPGRTFPVQVMRALPYEPIWPGLAMNTVFYAAIVWLMFATPGTIGRMRRWRRVRRGLCAGCGYPVGPGMSDVCSECGADVRVRRGKLEA